MAEDQLFGQGVVVIIAERIRGPGDLPAGEDGETGYGIVAAPALEVFREPVGPLQAFTHLHAVELEPSQADLRGILGSHTQAVEDELEVARRCGWLEEISEQALQLRARRDQALAAIRANKAEDDPLPCRSRPGKLAVFETVS